MRGYITVTTPPIKLFQVTWHRIILSRQECQQLRIDVKKTATEKEGARGGGLNRLQRNEPPLPSLEESPTLSLAWTNRHQKQARLHGQITTVSTTDLNIQTVRS